MNRFFAGAKAGVILLLVVLTAVSIGAYLVHGANQREDMARSWSSEGLSMTATGTLSRTLDLGLESDSPERSFVRCGLMESKIVNDPELVGKLRAAGFDTVQCGQLKADLQWAPSLVLYP
jgi:hypothetical protein